RGAGASPVPQKRGVAPPADSCDLVGLLCLRTAQAGGGVSRLTSAISVHNTLLAEHPDVLAALYRGYARHRRGEAAGRTALHALSHPGVFEYRRQGIGELCALLYRGRRGSGRAAD